MSGSTHAEKFGCTARMIDDFLHRCVRQNHGILSARCSAGTHDIDPERPAYVFAGETGNLTDSYCHMAECFLSVLDPATIRSMHDGGNRSSSGGGNNGDRKTPAAAAAASAARRGSASPVKRRRVSYQCFDCDNRRGSYKDFEECRRLRHDVVPYSEGPPPPSTSPSPSGDSAAAAAAGGDRTAAAATTAGGGGNGDRPTHTDHAMAIMADYNFLTLNDTREILVYRDGVYVAGGDIVIEEEAERRVPDCATVMRKEIQNTIRAHTYVDRRLFDSDDSKLVVENGVLDLVTGKLGAHTPHEPCRIKLNVAYDPDALSPHYDEFMSRVVPDEEDRLTLHELFGAALLRNSPNLEKITMCTGEGANGKSTLLGVYNDILGNQNVAHVSIHDLINHRFMRSNLDGKLANIYADISNNELEHMGVVKSLVTGETVTVEKKGTNSFDIENHAKLIFSCNRLPEISEDSDAIFRRFVIIPFTVRIPEDERNPALKGELLKEKSGIFNILLKCALEVRRAGALTHGGTTMETRRAWKGMADPVEGFSAGHLSREPGHNEPKSAVYEAYVAWCSNADLKPKTKQAFSARMERLKYRWGKARIDGKSVNAWLDVRLFSGEQAGDPTVAGGGGGDDDGIGGGDDILRPAAGGGGSSSGSGDDDSGTADGSSSDRPGDDSKRWSEMVPESEMVPGTTYYECRTCGAGPYTGGATGIGGRLISDVHRSMGHDYGPCKDAKKDGKEDGDGGT